MRPYDDAIWGEAGKLLGFEARSRGKAPWLADDFEALTADLGPPMRLVDATVEDWLVGERGGHPIVMRHAHGWTGSLVVTVGLRAPLFMGLRTSPLGRSRGERSPIRAMYRHAGIDPARVRALFEGPGRARALSDALSDMDVFSYAELSDTFAQLSRGGLPDGATFHVRAVEQAIDLAEKLDAARRALPFVDWELALPARWSEVAAHEGMAFDPARLVLEGPFSQLDARARVLTPERALHTEVEVRLPAPLGIGLRLFRERTLDKVLSLFTLKDITLGDPAFDGAFVVQGDPPDAVRERLGPEVRKLLLAILERGAAITARDDRLHALVKGPLVDPFPLLGDLAAAAQALARGETGRSAYR